MNKKRVYSRCRNFLLAGISLINIAFFAPDGGSHQAGDFFKIATLSAWDKPFDLTAAWCSGKIILLSLGLFLIIECLGTFLAVANRQRLAWTIYSLHFLPCLGFLLGGYYLLKALL